MLRMAAGELGRQVTQQHTSMRTKSNSRFHALNSAKWIVFLSLIAAWVTKTPYGQVSDFVGGNFPWPDDRSLKWPALLLERTIIESMICIPAAYLLAVLYRRSLYISIFLTSLYIPIATLDLSAPLLVSYTTAFVFFGMIVHAVLLIGGVMVFKEKKQTIAR